MAKKSSKASSVSWRTLMRRAKAADRKGHRNAAIKLRAQAADLRHKVRKPKKASTRRSNPGSLKADFNVSTGPDGRDVYTPVSAQAKAGAVLPPFPSGDTAPLAPPPQLAGITDAALYVKGLVQLARMKKAEVGEAEILQRLLSLQGVARYQGEQARESQATATLREVQRRADDKIVCGFLAEVDIAQKIYNGLPAELVWNVNSYVVTKIVDALNRAGYTPGGRVNGADRAEKREALMGKSHSDVHGAATVGANGHI